MTDPHLQLSIWRYDTFCPLQCRYSTNPTLSMCVTIKVTSKATLLILYKSCLLGMPLA